jgi:hypothetical protein
LLSLLTLLPTAALSAAFSLIAFCVHFGALGSALWFFISMQVFLESQMVKDNAIDSVVLANVSQKSFTLGMSVIFSSVALTASFMAMFFVAIAACLAPREPKSRSVQSTSTQ